MIYNDSARKIKRQALSDTALKMKLEAVLKNNLNKYFIKLENDFAKQYRDSGTIIDVNFYFHPLNDLLLEHYLKVSDKFDDQIRNFFGEHSNEASVNDYINIHLKNRFNDEVNNSAISINETNQNIIDKHVRDIIIAAGLAGLILSNFKIANEAKKRIRIENQNRLDAIGVTETQKPAEISKSIELDALIAAGVVFTKKKIDVAKASKKKQWVAILDGKTRKAHFEADGQIVIVEDPFIVMGQRLMFPGDMSLGATIDNIANCRCSSIYIF